ncbi:MAG: PhoH family protein [Candidatus Omnitrophica bacterium]|nr:PhoH family protein [Candidatus Omnitrophota bacterium]
MKKYFVLDTNVLIHNPNAIYSFAENIVIIPITVVEELDQLKNGADKKGMHARQVLRTLDEHIHHGALKKGAKMDNHGLLLISFLPDDIQPPGLDLAHSDNRIIAVAYALHHEKKMVFFISKDVNARIKAEALGIKSSDYEKEKVKYESLYKGWKEVPVSEENFKKLKDTLSFEKNGFSFYPNEYALVQCETDVSRQAVCRYEDRSQQLKLMSEACQAMGVKPLNPEQRIAFDLLLNNDIKLVTLVGQAGTGKTLLALACSLSKVLEKDPTYEKILMVRPIIPLGRDIGYLPGSKDKKLNYWMQPIFDNLDFILKQSVKKNVTSYLEKLSISDLTSDQLMRSDVLEIEALTYIRGRSLPNQYIIVDEAQNLTPHEIKTIISRAGNGTKIVLTGDPEQIDNPYLDANSNGLSYIVERLKRFDLVGHVFLTKSERSPLATLAVQEL